MQKANLFIIGAMKAGTTSIYSLLEGHPAIHMSPIKEPNYFSSDLWDISTHIRSLSTNELLRLTQNKGSLLHNALITEIKDYQLLFDNNASEIKFYGEASPNYLRSNLAARNIFEYNQDAKIIAILRDPIERAWSHFLMELNEARVPSSFSELIENELDLRKKNKISQHGILESGLYFECLSRYYELFPSSNILVIDVSEISDNFAFTEKLGIFLGLDRNLFPLNNTISANPTVSPRFQKINYIIAMLGLKQLLRHVIPAGLINMAKKFYYSKPIPSSSINIEDLACLREFYRDDVHKLTSLVQDTQLPWARNYVKSTG